MTVRKLLVSGHRELPNPRRRGRGKLPGIRRSASLGRLGSRGFECGRCVLGDLGNSLAVGRAMFHFVQQNAEPDPGDASDGIQKRQRGLLG